MKSNPVPISERWLDVAITDGGVKAWGAGLHANRQCRWIAQFHRCRCQLPEHLWFLRHHPRFLNRIEKPDIVSPCWIDCGDYGTYKDQWCDEWLCTAIDPCRRFYLRLQAMLSPWHCYSFQARHGQSRIIIQLPPSRISLVLLCLFRAGSPFFKINKLRYRFQFSNNKLC